MGPPGIVICGQFILQILAWGLFAAVERRGFIALPVSAANWVKKYGHPVTIIATLISTALAACSSYLFSWGVLQAITLNLHAGGMSLTEFISSLKISARSPIIDSKRPKWSVMSVALVILTGVQTSGWSGLLTPLVFNTETPLVGYEVDLSNPQLIQMQSSGALDECIFNTTQLFAFSVGQTEGGNAALKNSMGLAASLTLMDQTFNVSSVGALPSTLSLVNATGWFFSTNLLPSTITSRHDLPIALASSYSMIQQGFTADVSCQFQNLTADTTPSLSLYTDTVKDWTNGTTLALPVSFSQISSNCASASDKFVTNSTSALTLGEIDYVLMLACLGEANNYTLIFRGTGKVDYSNTDPVSGTILGTIDTTEIPGHRVADSGPAGLAAIKTIFTMTEGAQTPFSNVVGDQLHALIQQQDLSNLDVLIPRALENYIRGVAEYSGSVFRGCLSVTNGPFVNGAPQSISTGTEGTLYNQYVGWVHVSATTFWVLIPGALVAIATVWVVLIAVVQHAGEPVGEPFDPSNPIHLVAASAAGGLSDVLAGIKEEDIKAAEHTTVALGVFKGRSPALCEAMDLEPGQTFNFILTR
ncbi:hypothetical protein K438DRAFT_1968712 [Mycena galopus ATCC 62051]|nr:hypothetical protein K438DRAFT_1968712 [Mycena galopus ATCC 62051]